MVNTHIQSIIQVDYRGIRWNTWDGHKIVYSRMQILRCGKGVYNLMDFTVEWLNGLTSIGALCGIHGIMWDSIRL